jgi:hypothetical protein
MTHGISKTIHHVTGSRYDINMPAKALVLE